MKRSQTQESVDAATTAEADKKNSTGSEQRCTEAALAEATETEREQMLTQKNL